MLSVGRMEVAHDVNTDDSWSPAPDLVVCIARTDPEVRGRIQRLGVAKARREARQREFKAARDRLRRQEEESARERVEPLTGDRIDVSVWDNDLFNDDLYGRAALTLDGPALERGTLEVSMPNIKSVRLNFRMRPADLQLPRANRTCR